MSSVKVENMMPQAAAQIKTRTALGVRLATEDIFRLSRPKTPYATGDLANRTKRQVLGLHGEARWEVVYAGYQERGARADGSHRITNRPAGGQSWFAKAGAEAVANNTAKYFK